MLFTIVSLSVLALGGGIALTHASRWWSPASRPLVDEIDRLLPQTQCGRCTFGGCKPYAEALVHGEADINQCPPGGDRTMQALARLLDRAAKPIDPRFGDPNAARAVAWIDESLCIGCAKCLPACPVDAIAGAQRYMHTVIADDCTGCELCIPACPVDCIVMKPAPYTLPVVER